MTRKALLLSSLAALTAAVATPGAAHDIKAKAGNAAPATFDIVHTNVVRDGANIVFRMQVSAKAGTSKPAKTGALAGSEIYSYVWPTSLNSSVVGFDNDQGILALAVTSHPDFDDTPLYDENGDGDKANDGDLWHSHWVVLVPDSACGTDALKIRDIPEGAKPKLPATWPGLPILIDSPKLPPVINRKTVSVRVPARELGDTTGMKFDGVTAGLRINASVHAPLVCVAKVHDVASGNLSLPGRVM